MTPQRQGVSRRQGQPGFSLVEILVVAMLLGMALVVAIPRLFAPAGLDVELEARKVGADVTMARRLAISTRQNYVVTFTPVGGPYSSYSVAPQSGSPEPDFPKTFPADVTVSGTDQVTFQPSGATTAPGVITFFFTKETATAQVQIVGATGRVKVTSP